MNLTEQDLEVLVRMVWDALLPGEEGGLVLQPESEFGEAGYVSEIDVSGEWNVKVTFECTEVIAQSVASAMFALGPESLSQADLDDAVAEVVNQIGGNVKGTASGHCDLSLPRVEHQPTLVPHDDDGLTVSFLVGDSPFRVHVGAA